MAISLGGLALGAGTNLLGSYFGAEGQKDAARIAAQAGRFQPIDITTGLGGVSYDKEGGITTQLSPEMLALQQRLFGIGATGLEQFQTFDPTQAASLFTQRLGEAAAPLERQQQLSLENRLFKQGILGSTGGASRLGALQEAQNQAALQRQLAGQQYGTQEQERLFQNALGAYQAGTGLEQAATSLLAPFGSIGGRATQAGQFGAQLGYQAGVNRADMLSSFFGNLGQGLSQYFFGSPQQVSYTPSTNTLFSGAPLFGTGQDIGLPAGPLFR